MKLNKKTLLLLATLAFPVRQGYAQSSEQNYVKQQTMLDASGSRNLSSIQYYDGYARPSLKASSGIAAGGKYVYALTEYDNLNRVSNEWLPCVGGTSASWQSAANIRSLSSSTYQDSYAYNHHRYDAVGRLIAVDGAGAAWRTASKSERTQYAVNAANQVHKYVATAGSSQLSLSGYYPAKTLSVEQSTDEDGHTVEVYKDFADRVVLERTAGNHDTYYVYDNLDRLRYVLTPSASDAVASGTSWDITTHATLQQHAFYYEYDARGRCTQKRLPGCQPVLMSYDNRDRMIFRQDGVQRASNKWTFYEYDALNRLTCSGECTDQNASSGRTVRVQHYYDQYSFVGSTGFPTTQFVQDNSGNGTGALTGSVYSLLNGSGKVYEAHYYDRKGRETRTVRSNLLGGYDVSTTTYTFTDQPATMTRVHTASGKSSRTEVYTFTYDHGDRLSKLEHTLNGTKVTLQENTYDDLGRLSTRTHHGQSATKQTYAYNVRSWLTGITGTKFSQNLYYNTGTGTPRYNGSISSMTWKAGDETTTRGYKFAYDSLDRLQSATYGEGTSINTNTNRYTESVTEYDKNGNIKKLQRYGQTAASSYALIDNLTYTLTGNQVSRVDDAVTSSAYNGGFEFTDGAKQSNEYVYDGNGNLTKDLNKKISNISYNCLNLPATVTFSDGSSITYTYGADGRKLRTVHKVGSVTTTTDYCGNVIYENGTAKLLLTEVGYVTLTDNKYYYYLQDHQGNNRVVVDQSGSVKETNHYYPFGGVFATTGNVQPYKYNGKEYDANKGLNWYDYGARQYDAALGRFTTADRYAEKYLSLSPYQYGANNPANNIDINGDSTVVVISGTDVMGKHMKGRSETFAGYKLSVYSGLSLDTYKNLKSSNKLPEADYTTYVGRDAHFTKRGEEIIQHSSERYGSNNETPPGEYYLFRRGTNGDYHSGKYMLYVGDKDGSRLIKGPHGNRGGIAIHGWDPRYSQGCFTTFVASSNGGVQPLIDAIPDLNDSQQPVRLIVEPRKTETITQNNQKLWKGIF